MPELPEVETVRRGLEPLVVGSVVERVDVLRDSCVRRQEGGAREFSLALAGARFTAAVRRGKFLWMPFESAHHTDAAPLALSAHLGMSGQFRIADGDDAQPHPHCRARVRLQAARGPMTLDFVDQRTFGYLTVENVVPTADGGAGGHGSPAAALPGSVTHIARDALDQGADVDAIARAMRASRRSIKQVLLDQCVVSGIGNIYADEALWLARIHPSREAQSLSHDQAVALLEAARDVMTTALAQGGTSFDDLYVNVNGESGFLNIALKRVEGSRRRVISQPDLAQSALDTRFYSLNCSAVHRHSFGSRTLRGVACA